MLSRVIHKLEQQFVVCILLVTVRIKGQLTDMTLSSQCFALIP